jgi:hypothetical protein
MAPWFVRPLHTSIDRNVDGVFIVDSFGWTSDGKTRMRTYIPWALEHVYLNTGMLCVACLCGEGYAGEGYTELLDAAVNFTNGSLYEGRVNMFCVIISMGKDVHKLAKDKPRAFKGIGIEAIANGMQNLNLYCQESITANSLIVYGGTHETWRYNEKFSEEFCSIYDEYVDAVVRKLRLTGTEVVKEIHLGQLQTVDRIGHVHESSLEQVARMWVLWANMAAGKATKKISEYPRVSYPRSKL